MAISCKESSTTENPAKVDLGPTRAPRSPPTTTTAGVVAATRAQTLRAEMTAEELHMVREELAPMRSKNRWPDVEQTAYLKSCEAAKKDDASINRRMCECTMEVVMNRFATGGEYGKYVRDQQGQADDKELASMTGLCAAAYGDDAPTGGAASPPPAKAPAAIGIEAPPKDTVGSRLVMEKGCNACHSVDGSRLVGPSFRGRWATKISTSAGKVVVDERYLAESIQKPTAKIASGFPPACPATQMKKSEIDEVVAFIKALNDTGSGAEPQK